MSKNLLCMVMMLGLAVSVFAGQTYDDLGADHLFSNPDNWALGLVPNIDEAPSETNSYFNDADLADGAICVIDDTQAAWAFKVSQAGRKATAQIVNDGVYTAGNWGMDIARGGNSTGDAGTHGKLFISGGEIVNTPWINMPTNWADELTTVMKADLVMQDGVVNAGWIQLGINEYDVGTMKLYGGVINSAGFVNLGSSSSSIEVGGGVLIMNGDYETVHQTHITNGWITAAPGYGTPQVDYDVTNPLKTTLRADSVLDPFPADDSQTSAALTELTWTLPASYGGGATVSCDVYFGSPDDKVWESLADPNIVLPTPKKDYLAAGGVEGDWVPSEIGLPLVDSGNTTGSYSVSLVADTDYCWKVDVFDSSLPADPNNPDKLVMSHIFEFDTSNVAPVVDAGNNLYSFLDGGPRTVTLDGTLVVDDGAPVVAAPVWSVVSANTPFEDGPQTPVSAASYSFVSGGWNAQFQMSLAGDYTLQLIGDDTDLQSAPQTMIVFLRDTACDSTLIFPTFEALIGDINLDCIVDLNDFADLASVWLGENAMDDTTEYIPE